MFGWIRRYFPAKARSLEEFLRLVREYGCTAVSAEGNRTMQNGVRTAAVGVIGTSRYTVELIATGGKRKVIFTQPCGEKRSSSEYGIADRDDRERAAVLTLVTADAALQEVQKRLPQLISVSLLSGRGPLNEETRSRLRADARKLGVEPLVVID